MKLYFPNCCQLQFFVLSFALYYLIYYEAKKKAVDCGRSEWQRRRNRPNEYQDAIRPGDAILKNMAKSEHKEMPIEAEQNLKKKRHQPAPLAIEPLEDDEPDVPDWSDKSEVTDRDALIQVIDALTGFSDEDQRRIIATAKAFLGLG